MTKTVLILGASGKIGTHAARAFKTAGWQIKTFNRKTDDMTQAAMGCDVIVNGLNPPNYHNWDTIIPAITKQVIGAARTSGATVIIPGNVYVYGDTPGEWSETTPHRPVSRKGQIRVDMERAYRDSGVQTIILRAGNFIDPDQNGDMFSLVILKSIAKGKITFTGSPDVMQPYGYLPDWARVAVGLAEKRSDLGVFEDVPLFGHAFTLNEFRAGLERILGRDLRVGRFPWWTLRLAAPVWELARELGEMRYLWETNHTLSADRLTTLLPEFKPAPMDEVFRATLPEALRTPAPIATGAAVTAA